MSDRWNEVAEKLIDEVNAAQLDDRRPGYISAAVRPRLVEAIAKALESAVRRALIREAHKEVIEKHRKTLEKLSK